MSICRANLNANILSVYSVFFRVLVRCSKTSCHQGKCISAACYKRKYLVTSHKPVASYFNVLSNDLCVRNMYDAYIGLK